MDRARPGRSSFQPPPLLSFLLATPCRCHLGEHEHAVIVVLSFFLLTAILSDGALGEHEHDNRHFLDTS